MTLSKNYCGMVSILIIKLYFWVSLLEFFPSEQLDWSTGLRLPIECHEEEHERIQNQCNSIKLSLIA